MLESRKMLEKRELRLSGLSIYFYDTKFGPVTLPKLVRFIALVLLGL
jgi:hypothetical protein